MYHQLSQFRSLTPSFIHSLPKITVCQACGLGEEEVKVTPLPSRSPLSRWQELKQPSVVMITPSARLHVVF